MLGERPPLPPKDRLSKKNIYLGSRAAAVVPTPVGRCPFWSAVGHYIIVTVVEISVVEKIDLAEDGTLPIIALLMLATDGTESNQATHLRGVAAYTVTNSEVIVLQIVTIVALLSKVEGVRHWPISATAIFGKDIVVCPFELSGLHNCGTC